jgi:hypothetical protein
MSIYFTNNIPKPLGGELLIIWKSYLQVLNSKLSDIYIQRKYFSMLSIGNYERNFTIKASKNAIN